LKIIGLVLDKVRRKLPTFPTFGNDLEENFKLGCSFIENFKKLIISKDKTKVLTILPSKEIY